MTITLYRTQKSWTARYSGPGAEAITELFGTNILPCAFTPEAAPETVLSEIRRLNPEADVEIADA